MKIKELTLYTNRIEEQKHFYETTLGFTIYQEDRDRFWLQLGWTKLYFKRSIEDYKYHYCFLIPSNKLLEAMQWLSPKVDIITAEGDEKVVYFDTWNAHSFYFYDAAGNIAECIVRHDLQNHSNRQFSIECFLCVNEIGLGTDNISKTNQQLEDNVGTLFWKGDKERFAANGSQEGLFLMPNYLVKETWFPSDIAIKPNPLMGIIENGGISNNVYFKDGEVTT
ncbi:MAG: VOC family protein [Sphingobacterium sp.]